MRRRRKGTRKLSADEVVTIFAEAMAAHPGASAEVQRYAVHHALAEAGYTPLDAIRARYWIRRGRPPGYYWDEPDRPVSRFPDGEASSSARLEKKPGEGSPPLPEVRTADSRVTRHTPSDQSTEPRSRKAQRHD